jgi:hypothetical protein
MVKAVIGATWSTLMDRSTWVGTLGTVMSWATLERVVSGLLALATLIYMICRIYYIVRNRGEK